MGADTDQLLEVTRCECRKSCAGSFAGSSFPFLDHHHDYANRHQHVVVAAGESGGGSHDGRGSRGSSSGSRRE